MALSISYTGKYTSARHQEAREDGKLTAGEFAKFILKTKKMKVTASELRPFATEWHHSGFYKNNFGPTMGKTWFFNDEEIEIILENFEAEYLPKILANRKKEEEIAAEESIEIFYFQAGFTKCGSGRRTYWQPVADFGNAFVKPSEKNNFLNHKKTEISKEEFESLKQFNGRHLERYEAFENFKTRMLK